MAYSELRYYRRKIATADIKCPYCGSEEIWRAGFDITLDGRRQRFQCKRCARYLYKTEIKRVEKKEVHGRTED